MNRSKYRNAVEHRNAVDEMLGRLAAIHDRVKHGLPPERLDDVAFLLDLLGFPVQTAVSLVWRKIVGRFDRLCRREQMPLFQ